MPIYPLLVENLSLGETARNWANDSTQSTTESDALGFLLDAFWQGDIRLRSSVSGPVFDRKAATAALVSSAPHPGIVIFESAAALPHQVEKTEDGGIVVDLRIAIVFLRIAIVLPLDSSNWSDAVLGEAWGSLSQCGGDSYSVAFIKGMSVQQVSRDEFALLCDARGIQRPVFWFAAGQPPERRVPGRPSAMRRLEKEMKRRADNGELLPKIAQEARFLSTWAQNNLPSQLQAPKPKSVENALRAVYLELRGRATNRTKP
jgi:hypothetical protein